MASAQITVDPALSSIALDRARTMADHDKIDRGAGREFDSRLAGAGFNPRGAVENVGAGYHTLAEAFSGWRDSPSHRANMLNPASIVSASPRSTPRNRNTRYSGP